jgi:hypothetical protein
MHTKCVPDVSAHSTTIQLSFEPADWSAIDETYSSAIWPAVLQALTPAKQVSILHPQR